VGIDLGRSTWSGKTSRDGARGGVAWADAIGPGPEDVLEVEAGASGVVPGGCADWGRGGVTGEAVGDSHALASTTKVAA
jgi:hypothetical protein